MNAEPLEPVLSFMYLDCTIAYNNINWVAVYHNLLKARQWWGMIFKVLKKTGATVWARRILYKVVTQTVLLYGSLS